MTSRFIRVMNSGVNPGFNVNRKLANNQIKMYRVEYSRDSVKVPYIPYELIYFDNSPRDAKKAFKTATMKVGYGIAFSVYDIAAGEYVLQKYRANK